MSEHGQATQPALEDPITRTYRYARAAIIGSMLLLFSALALQIIDDGGAVRGSISEYYYGPVRGILVGTLMATGVAVVAVRGRPGLEDISLNLVGMLAPMVALIPTPLLPADGTLCPAGLERCIPAEFLPGVVNNVSALLLLGIPALVFAWWTAVATGRCTGPTRVGLTSATALWVAVALWFGPSASWPLRQSFVMWSHYASAIAMFALIIVVVWFNATRTDHRMRMTRMSVSYRTIYFAVAAAMAVALVVALVVRFATSVATGGNSTVLFWLEAVLLLLFVVFWVAQTREFWNRGLPAEVCRITADVGDKTS